MTDLKLKELLNLISEGKDCGLGKKQLSALVEQGLVEEYIEDGDPVRKRGMGRKRPRIAYKRYRLTPQGEESRNA